MTNTIAKEANTIAQKADFVVPANPTISIIVNGDGTTTDQVLGQPDVIVPAQPLIFGGPQGQGQQQAQPAQVNANPAPNQNAGEEGAGPRAPGGGARS